MKQLATVDGLSARVAAASLLLIGGLGAFMQSGMLWNALVESVPFKAFDTDHFINLGDTLASFAPWLSIAMGVVPLLFIRRRFELAGLLPLILCPAIYIAGLHLSGVPHELSSPDSDGAIPLFYLDYYHEAIDWMFAGLGVYMVCAIVVRLIASSLNESSDQQIPLRRNHQTILE